jgi:hypothetical protein
MPTRVMLVEDHADFRHVMTVVLAQEPDLERARIGGRSD